jgi:hypothetical protein
MSNSQSNKVKDNLGDSGLKTSQKKTEKSREETSKNTKKGDWCPYSQRDRALWCPLGGLGEHPIQANGAPVCTAGEHQSS